MDFWEDFGIQTIIRATKETSIDREVLIIGKVVRWSVGVPTSLSRGLFRLRAVISIALIFTAFFKRVFCRFFEILSVWGYLLAGKMEAKIDFCDVFPNLCFECVSGSYFCCFLEAPNLENHALASTGARFSQNRRFRKISKKNSISAPFSEVKTSKNQETMVLKSVFVLSI